MRKLVIEIVHKIQNNTIPCESEDTSIEVQTLDTFQEH